MITSWKDYGSLYGTETEFYKKIIPCEQCLTLYEMCELNVCFRLIDSAV